MNFNSVILKTALITLCISHGPMKAMEGTNDSNPALAAALKMVTSITSDTNLQQRLRLALSHHHTTERPQFSQAEERPTFSEAELDQLIRAAIESPNPGTSPATAVWVAAFESNSSLPCTISFGRERKWYDSPKRTGTGSVVDNLNSLSLNDQANQPGVHFSFVATPPSSFTSHSAPAVSPALPSFTIGSTSHSAGNNARKRSGQGGQGRRKAKKEKKEETEKTDDHKD